MALLRAVGSFNITTGTADVSVVTTDPDSGTFQPKLVIFLWNTRTESTDAAGSGHFFKCMGWMTDAGTQGCGLTQSEDNSANADCDRVLFADRCIADMTIAGAIDGTADFASMNADGFSLDIARAFTVDRRVIYIALGGPDITNVFAGSDTAPGSDTTKDTTAPGFQPDAVLFLANGATTLSSSLTDSALSIGCAAGSSPVNAVLAGMSDHNTGNMDTSSYCRDVDECIVFPVNPTSLTHRAKVTAWLSNGFTLSWSECTTAMQFLYLAIKGPRFTLGTFLTQTDTSTPIVASGFGYQPRGGIVFSACKAEDAADTPSTHDEWSVGAFQSATGRAAVGGNDEDGPTASECRNAIEHDGVYVNMDLDDAVEGVMDVSSIDSDGVTFIMDDADPSQAFGWYLAFGDTPAVGGTVVKDLISVGIIPFAR